MMARRTYVGLPKYSYTGWGTPELQVAVRVRAKVPIDRLVREIIATGEVAFMALEGLSEGALVRVVEREGRLEDQTLT